jgi:phosphohistidine phosphatase SixA
MTEYKNGKEGKTMTSRGLSTNKRGTTASLSRWQTVQWVVILLLALALALIAGMDKEFHISRPRARMTTVVLLRHAERDNGSLNEDGLERAERLAHVAFKAGVTAIYTTDTERARQTVQPLADLLKRDPLIYNVGSAEQIRQFATKVLRDHAGKVVLIVGHNPTVPLVIDALGGDSTGCSIGAAYDEFDNLCTVTVGGPGIATVVNLQYGRPSP